MIPIKHYIAKQFMGNTYHFKCDCIMPIDVVGTVVDYEISGYEIILSVSTDKKIIHIGLNTSSLTVEDV